MKIAMIIDRFYPDKGGAEAAIHELAKFLVKEGNHVTFLLREGEASADWDLEKISCTQPLRWWRERSFARLASERGDERRFDVCIGFRHVSKSDIYLPHGGLHRAAMERPLDAISSPIRRKWRLIARRYLSPKHRVFRSLESRLVKEGGLIIALSDMVERDFRGEYPECRVKKIFGGVDLERFEATRSWTSKRGERLALGLPDREGIWALFVAHHPELKGLPAILVAMKRRDMADVHLVWMGRGHSKRFRKRVREFGLSDRVHLVGDVSKPEGYYRAMDVLIHPTFYDPCSRVVLEALASGLPVVTSRRNGACEVIDHGAGVILEDPSSPEEIACAMNSLRDTCFNSEGWVETSKAARRSAEKAGLDRHLMGMLDEISRASAERRARS